MTEAISTERTRNYLRQITGSVVYKAFAMAASFLAIPLMIRYLGQEQFGVWSTLLTVMSWIVFFDLGVGNGLRNKVAEALAKNDKSEAANYIASGYSLIGLVALMLGALVTVASFFVPWQIVFNTQAVPEAGLRLTVQIAAFFVVLNFWLGLIGALLGAMQKTSLTALGQLISNVLALMLVFVLIKTTDASMSSLAFAYGISLVVTNALLSLWFYRSHPELRPKLSLNRQHVQPLLSVGMQFFTIQLAVLVIFTTDKMLITQLFGPQYVAQYEVVFKLFNVITFCHSLISAPLWSAYTDAYHRSDIEWIKRMLRKQMGIFGIVILLVVAMVILAKPFLKLWLGNDMDVPLLLLISMGLLVLTSIWNNIYGVILGGIGKVRLGAIYTVFTALLNIPLSCFIAMKLGLGVAGIVLGTLASISVSSVISPIQVYFFIYARSKNSYLLEVLR